MYMINISLIIIIMSHPMYYGFYCFFYAISFIILRLKIALVEATNQLEDEGAAPRRRGAIGRQYSVIIFYLIGIFAYFKLF